MVILLTLLAQNLQQIISPCHLFVSKKVFEGVQNHVLEILRKCDFGPKSVFDPLSNCSSPQLWSISKRNKADQIFICEVTPTRDSEVLEIFP